MIERQSIFIDTSAIFALFNKSDSLHKEAKSYYHSVLNNAYRLFTTNIVLTETFTLIKRRNFPHECGTICQSIKNSSVISIFYSNEYVENKAFEIFLKYSDQRFSFTDCISFAFMELHDIDQAFTFDDDFKIFGFKVNPELKPLS
ncbi:MAG: PIN domain-containing protein [Actinobacteria bacterium]|nr:PIN domain-containing protein [Actinomycetota bacterium]